MAELNGILFIGDPHLASRPPGFRKDDYPQVILEKLRWCLAYAKEHDLLPVLLGDLFDFPRDNATWMIVQLLAMLDNQTLAVYGNHDCKENTLSDNDTLSILVHAKKLRLLSPENPWIGTINDRPILIAGTCWGQPLPKTFDPQPHLSGLSTQHSALVFWITHHDLHFPGYEESARFDCREIAGVNVVVNGHIHRDLGRVQSGKTLWINPGNITRVARSDASRAHVPSVLRADVAADSFALSRVPVPHSPYDDVFHAGTMSAEIAPGESAFIRELAALESVRTASGAGLREFLSANLASFDAPVAAEIETLAREVLDHAG